MQGAWVLVLFSTFADKIVYLWDSSKIVVPSLNKVFKNHIDFTKSCTLAVGVEIFLIITLHTVYFL